MGEAAGAFGGATFGREKGVLALTVGEAPAKAAELPPHRVDVLANGWGRGGLCVDRLLRGVALSARPGSRHLPVHERELLHWRAALLWPVPNGRCTAMTCLGVNSVCTTPLQCCSVRCAGGRCL